MKEGRVMRDVREGKYVIVIVILMSIMIFILRGSDARCVRCQLLINWFVLVTASVAISKTRKIENQAALASWYTLT